VSTQTKAKKLQVLEAPSPREALQEAVASFVRRGQARSLSPRTVEFYQERLGVFLRWLDAEKLDLNPADASADVVRDFLAAEKERTSAATANHAYVALRALLRYLEAEEWIAANPMERVEKVRTTRKLIETFTQEQVEALLAQCSRSFNGARLRAIILTLVDCGLRASELCGLTLDGVSWDEGTLKVMGKGSKERVVPFGEATRQSLLAYVSRRGNLRGQGALFVTSLGDALNRHELHRVLSEAGKRAGLTGVRCSPHTFRHTCAVSYLRNGGDAFTLQKLLGHSDLAMTRRYCELSSADVVAKHRQFSPGDRFLSQVQKAGGRKRLR